jgi:hypothetical protein
MAPLVKAKPRPERFKNALRKVPSSQHEKNQAEKNGDQQSQPFDGHRQGNRRKAPPLRTSLPDCCFAKVD